MLRLLHVWIYGQIAVRLYYIAPCELHTAVVTICHNYYNNVPWCGPQHNNPVCSMWSAQMMPICNAEIVVLVYMCVYTRCTCHVEMINSYSSLSLSLAVLWSQRLKIFFFFFFCILCSTDAKYKWSSVLKGAPFVYSQYLTLKCIVDLWLTCSLISLSISQASHPHPPTPHTVHTMTISPCIHMQFTAWYSLPPYTQYWSQSTLSELSVSRWMRWNCRC